MATALPAHHAPFGEVTIEITPGLIRFGARAMVPLCVRPVGEGAGDALCGPMRFPMTLGGLTKVMTFAALAGMSVVLPLQYFVVFRHIPLPGMKLMMLGVLLLSTSSMLFMVAIAPRAVRITANKLMVERLFWPDFELPLREVVGVEEGPPISLMGKVHRVAGNGGMMGFSGLFRVSDLGLVRVWATRMGVPTVLVRRAHDRPLLLGVDDPSALLMALRRAARC